MNAGASEAKEKEDEIVTPDAPLLAGFKNTLGVLLLLLATWLILARVSFDPKDVAYFSSPPQSPAGNYCGSVGASVTHVLLLYFGEAFWLLPFAAILFCHHLFYQRPVRLYLFAMAFLFALPALSFLLILLNPQTPKWAASYGGYFGYYFGRLSLGTIGPGGTWILVVAALIFAGWGFDIAFFVTHTYKAVKKRIVGFREWLERRRIDKARKKDLEKSIPAVPSPSQAPKGPAAPIPRPEPEAVSQPSTPRKSKKKSANKAKPREGGYQLPDMSILQQVPPKASDAEDILKARAEDLESMFGHFNLDCKVVNIVRGPTITQFEMTIAEGIAVNKIKSLADNVALRLKAPTVRIVAPIPGKGTIGIEVPNRETEVVNLRSIIEHPDYERITKGMFLPLLLGKDVAGTPLVSDLTKMPHFLVAGTTGSGKSVCINSVIASLLLFHTPDECRLILVDPKMVEMKDYENIPHLMSDVITDMRKVVAVLDWACNRMDERYNLLSHYKVRQIKEFNGLSREHIEENLPEGKTMEDIEYKMPFIVLIVDEFSDLMMTGAKEIERYIIRLAQKSRAVGIHVILATQKPNVTVITGLIKANMPTRVAFRVTSQVDSRTILDSNGAEKLLGQGDMLFLGPGTSNLSRSQGVWVADEEIRDLVEFWKDQGEPEYEDMTVSVAEDDDAVESTVKESAKQGDEADKDPEIYLEAVRVVLESNRPSTSFVQRQLGVGYNKASKLIEAMENRGIVSTMKGNGARDLMISLEEWKEMTQAADVSSEVADDDQAEDESDESEEKE